MSVTNVSARLDAFVWYSIYDDMELRELLVQCLDRLSLSQLVKWR